MSVNQVVRSVGFSLGSAVSGLILAAHTATGSFAPSDSGYSTAAWTAAALALVTIVLVAGINTSRNKQHQSWRRRQPSRRGNPSDRPRTAATRPTTHQSRTARTISNCGRRNKSGCGDDVTSEPFRPSRSTS
jgi:hypothetical protein